LCVLLREVFEGAFDQSSRGGSSDEFHLVEVGIECRSVVAVCVPGDDFAPLFGEFLHGCELFG
jgi:hypothetical protein